MCVRNFHCNTTRKMSIEDNIPDRLRHTGVCILQRYYDDPGDRRMRRPRLLRSIGGLPHCNSPDELKEAVARIARPSAITTLGNLWVIICPARRAPRMARFIREGVHTMTDNIEFGTQYPEGVTWEEARRVCNIDDTDPPVDDVDRDSEDEDEDEDEHYTAGLYSVFTLEFTPSLDGLED